MRISSTKSSKIPAFGVDRLQLESTILETAFGPAESRTSRDHTNRSRAPMTSEITRTLCSAASVAAVFLGWSSSFAGDRVDFRREVLPILSDRCFACHGPDAKHRKGDLRLDDKAELFKMVEAGKPDESELIRRLETDDHAEVMPPAKLNKPLTKDQIATLKSWV